MFNNRFLTLKEIGKIYDEEKKKLDLDEYTKKLVQTKKKLNTIQATIISVQVINLYSFEGFLMVKFDMSKKNIKKTTNFK